MTPVFIHGLESSSRGTKGTWFKERFPGMLICDFIGSFEERMVQLKCFLAGRANLVLVGSSFGGLMASVYAIEYGSEVARVVLLAPALNFPEFDRFRSGSTSVPTHLYIGDRDAICPADLVIPAAQEVFTDLVVNRVDDDHLLHATFRRIDWNSMLR
ncbi:MAG: alpha/beta hydrolase [Proteobacteria bacterium]|nr:alpha/beta hydrolase [Pseudomonadota bacterium]MBU1737799.1 alpha/beta hydrolase [Pseudomonadota bacterium]